MRLAGTDVLVSSDIWFALLTIWMETGDGVGWLRADRGPEGLHGRGSNSAGRFGLVQHCDRLVQTLRHGLSSQPAAAAVAAAVSTAAATTAAAAATATTTTTAAATAAALAAAKFAAQPRFRRLKEKWITADTHTHTLTRIHTHTTLECSNDCRFFLPHNPAIR